MASNHDPVEDYFSKPKYGAMTEHEMDRFVWKDTERREEEEARRGRTKTKETPAWIYFVLAGLTLVNCLLFPGLGKVFGIILAAALFLGVCRLVN